MSRTTRSITLVLLGTGLAVGGCDDRDRRYGVTPGGTDPTYAVPTTGPASAGGGATPYYSYPAHSGYGRPWFGGGTAYRSGFASSAFSGSSFSSSSARRGSASGSSGSRSATPSESHGSSSSAHGTTFGGFGSHASSGGGGGSSSS